MTFSIGRSVVRPHWKPWTLIPLLILSSTCLSQASIVSGRSITQLVAEADQILIAKVLVVQIGGPEMRADVEILRTLRGAGKPGENICIRMPVDPGNMTYPRPATERPGIATMLFLKDGPGCALAVAHITPPLEASHYFWQVSETPPDVPLGLTGGDIELQLAAEALVMFPKMKAPPHPFAVSMVTDVAMLIKRKSDPTRWLQWISRPELGAPDTLRSVLQIINSDPAGLPALVAEIGRPSPNVLGRAAWGLLGEYYRSPDPDGIRLIGQMTESEDILPFIKLDALLALVKVSTPETVPYLMRAIEDPQLNDFAMNGLARYVLGDRVTTSKELIHRGTPLPRHKSSPEMLEELKRLPRGDGEQVREQKIEFWKDWGRRHGFIQ